MVITHIEFPGENTNLRRGYWEMHFRQFVDYAAWMNINMRILTRNKVGVWPYHMLEPNCFSMLVNEQPVVVDYSDFPEHGIQDYNSFGIVLKRQYRRGQYPPDSFVRPLGPPVTTKILNTHMQYLCNSDRILYNQRLYGDAILRRAAVLQLLKSTYKDHVDTCWTDQRLFWEKIQNCLVAVVVPGARNDMLDRGHLELLALGVCTIAPPIHTVLPWYSQLIPNKHYVLCCEDYSDLLTQIEWCREHRDMCRDIGYAASQLFQECYSPSKFWEWLGTMIA